jgi:hypothetical protein
MLGSPDDADDALEETPQRGWRGLPGYAPLDAHPQPYPDRYLEELAAPIHHRGADHHPRVLDGSRSWPHSSTAGLHRSR